MSAVWASVSLPTFRTHTESATCRRGRITKRSREIANNIIQHEEQVFTIDGAPIENVGSFPYLGRKEARTDADWGAIYTNLRKARYKWYKLSKLLTREGANPKIFGKFYKGVVHVILLYGCESWTLTEAMWTVLKGFHHRAARRMTNMMAYKGPGDKWVYPPLEEALKKAGLYTMEHYVNKRQHRIVDYISTRPIWAHCMDASRKPGTPARTIYWWNQYRGQAKPTDEHWEDGTPCL